MAKRLVKVTPEQIDVMVNFMIKHSCLIHPKLWISLPYSERDEQRRTIDRLWGELCANLNNQTFGPKKTLTKWRRVWSDLKSEAGKLKKRQGGNSAKIRNPIYRKIANLLAKTSSQCSVLERHSISVSSEAEPERDVGIKYEESINYQHSEIESITAQPFVVSVKSLGTQPTETGSQNFLKCEETADNDSSGSEVLIPYVQTIYSNKDGQSLEDAVNSTMPVNNNTKSKSKRRKICEAATEDTHLCDLIETEKEKSDRLLAIANAISSSNEIQEKQLKIEEERNRLIQQRNTIESERNDIFKSLLEHLKSKEIF